MQIKSSKKIIYFQKEDFNKFWLNWNILELLLMVKILPWIWFLLASLVNKFAFAKVFSYLVSSIPIYSEY